MLAYLASPYNDPNPAVMRKRVLSVLFAAGRLMAAGRRVFSPIAHNVAIIDASGLQPGWGVWAEFDSDMLARCDMLLVLMLPGWENSMGIKAELEEAIRLGLPVEYLDPKTIPHKGPTWAETLRPLPPEVSDVFNA